MYKFLSTLIFLLVSSTAAETIQDSIPDIETFMKIGSASDPAISLDGNTVFFRSAVTGVNQLYRLTETGWPYQLSVFNDGIDWYVLSHDSKIAIVGASVGGTEKTQLFRVDTQTGKTNQLTQNSKIQYGGVAFSPDDRRIYYRSNEINGTDFHIWAMTLADSKAELLWEKSGYNEPIVASEDGKSLLFELYRSNRDNDLFLLNVETKTERLLTKHKGESRYQFANLSPDGLRMYFATDQNSDRVLRPAVMDLMTGKWEFLDKEMAWECEGLALSPDGKYLCYLLNENGYSTMKLLELFTRASIRIPSEKGIFDGVKFSSAGTMVYSFNSATRPADIWKWDVGKAKSTQLTFSTSAGIDYTLFDEPKPVQFLSFDGVEIPGLLYLPKGYSVGPIPFIIHAHGGPEEQTRPEFIRHFQYLLLHGYGIFAINPRGSRGYGQKYTNLDDYKKRLDSVKDYIEGAKWLIEQKYTIPQMLGIKGSSYGGYMTMACITEAPYLFAAACNTVGIVNFVSFLKGTADYRRALREAEYGPLSDSLFLASISPIRKADSITTALMVVHGENDPRVPVGEARQIIASLTQRGVPVDSLIFADEGHGVAKLKNSLIYYRRMVDFFDKHLKK